MASKVTCSNCGWSWNKSDSSKKDMYVCHQCGRDNSNKSEGWLDKYDDGGTMQEYQENYNDYSVSAPEGMQGNGYSNVGRDYSPAWGGQFAMGGSLPGAVGFTYARTGNIPSNGKYAKKTLASAKKGGVVKDDNGYLDPDNHGKVVEIDSPYITMEGVDQPLLGISDEGDQKYMTPGKNYKFKGKKVREYPMAKNGKRQEQKGLINLDDLLNFTNYNIPKAYEGMELSTTTDTTTVNPNSPENKKLYGSPDEKSIDQFYRDYYNSPLFKKNIGISEGKLSEYPNITSSSDPKLINSILAKHASVNTTYDPGKITAYDLGSNVNLGSSYDDVFQNRGLTYAHEKGHIDELDILKLQPSMIEFLVNKNKLSSGSDKNVLNNLFRKTKSFEDQYSPVTGEKMLSKEQNQKNELETYLRDRQQYKSELQHDNAPTEIRADIMGLRYAAAQAGIWDPTKSDAGNFTPEMLQKLYKLQKLNLPMKGKSRDMYKPYELISPNKESLRKSNLPAVDAPKSPGLFLDRTRQRFDDSDLLYLMNNLAQNQSPMISEMITGKDGAKVKKGWLEKYN
jgi:hypothetical protein